MTGSGPHDATSEVQKNMLVIKYCVWYTMNIIRVWIGHTLIFLEENGMMRKIKKWLILIFVLCYLATLPQWNALISTIENIAKSEFFLKIKDNATTIVGKYVDEYTDKMIEGLEEKE